MRQITNRQLVGALIAALVVLGGGGTAGGLLLEERGATSAEKGLAELKQRHDADITLLREQIGDMRGLLDALLVKTSSVESQTTMLVTMVRDHTQGEK